MNKFQDALATTRDPDLPASEAAVLSADAAVAAKEKAVLKCNALAIVAFMMAFQNETLMKFISKGSTTAWPNGNTTAIVKALHKKYKPKDIMSKAEMKLEITKITMGKKGDPTNLFTKISAVEM